MGSGYAARLMPGLPPSRARASFDFPDTDTIDHPPSSYARLAHPCAQPSWRATPPRPAAFAR